MVVVKAPMNIALIKYWGKSDNINIIPLNESISVSLSIYTTTKVVKCDNNTSIFILNGVQQSLESHPRINACLSRFKKVCEYYNKSHFNVKIDTTNQFPTASGLASSASGGAALVIALNLIYKLELSKDHLSILARLTSGSACRSIHGGMVKWQIQAPELLDESIFPISSCRAASLPNMTLYALIVILDKNVKRISSTTGMQNTVNTSALFKERLELVPNKIKNMENFILSNDFENLAELTMVDAMNFHACCLDTFPPIHYLNDLSFDVIDKVHEYNKNGLKCAYTFDAGANAVLLFETKENRNEFKVLISYETIECESCSGPIIE